MVSFSKHCKISQFKMLGVSKQAKRNGLSLSDKILVIIELQRMYHRAKSLAYPNHKNPLFGKQKKLLVAHQSNANPSCKRARKSTHEDIGEELLQWFKEIKSIGLISGSMLHEKAND